MARFLPRDVGTILMVYLSVVRPIEIAFLRFLEKDEQVREQKTADYQHFVFCLNGRRMSSDQICYSFESTMAKFGIPIGVSQYRHVAIAFARHHIKDITAIAYQEHYMETDAFDLQAVHSVKTGITSYGISSTDLPSMSSEVELSYFHVSRKWQNWLFNK